MSLMDRRRVAIFWNSAGSLCMTPDRPESRW
jgi:hypothetical protein